MVLLIIIPFLNGYFIGNITYFQTNLYIAEHCVITQKLAGFVQTITRQCVRWIPEMVYTAESA